eukprot:CAMPEP_0198351742 /NCGR_PEP_ID=MMETSP1450-20131203/104104_1 /TAXON_ID=753684 ORGANISM="Madagascaria erythrocladiodes, Strain CCMP3234" /NCGR_SAMPLE_ID=MMETSP1450 /ASSEMBLY_ACC=CAM_ASM_001115 /LENGTH=191 /DNA_ID=CAMNT_0044057693 /DNA_START=27 /DNA_END=602 /DNA_ORIENTATION=-
MSPNGSYSVCSRRRACLATVVPEPSLRGDRKWAAGALEGVLTFAKSVEGRLRRVAIRGDGRCLFRSIARSIAALDGRKLSESLERADADALRMVAFKTMCTGKRRAEFEKSMLVEGSFSAYCSSMQRPDHYGGEAEMYVLSEVLRMPIAVYLSAGSGFQKIVEYGSEFGSKVARPIRVLYNGVNHYDLLLE